MLFPGLLRAKGASPEFTPLLRTNDDGRHARLERGHPARLHGHLGHQPQSPPLRQRDGLHPGRADPRPAGDRAAEGRRRTTRRRRRTRPRSAEIHVIAIADLDLISEQFFELRRRKIENLELDNVTFVLNCIDVLAGDESFIPLRKHRLKHRTLERLEAQTKNFIEERQVQTKAAEDAAKEQLDVEQKNLDKQVDAIRARKDVDERTKEIMLMNIQEVANRRLEVKKTSIEDQKRKKIQESKGDRSRRSAGSRTRSGPKPSCFRPCRPVLGLIVFFVRWKRENQGANPNRLV